MRINIIGSVRANNVGTIGLVTLTATPDSMSEGDGPTEVTVTATATAALTADATIPINVPLPASTATPGTDYLPTNLDRITITFKEHAAPAFTADERIADQTCTAGIQITPLTLPPVSTAGNGATTHALIGRSEVVGE